MVDRVVDSGRGADIAELSDAFDAGGIDGVVTLWNKDHVGFLNVRIHQHEIVSKVVVGVTRVARIDLGRLMITGGLFGWTVGILLTPVSPNERKRFSEYGKAITTFLSGYVVARADKFFNSATADVATVTTLLANRLFLFVSASLLGALATFVWRSYLSSQAARSGK